jgi:hypothetical protein
MLLFRLNFLIRMDCWLLSMDEGDYVPWHKDEVDGASHHRLNIVLRKAKKGGAFLIRRLGRRLPVPVTDRVILFRPDKAEHRVTRVRSGSRLVLSIGWLRKKEVTCGYR